MPWFPCRSGPGASDEEIDTWAAVQGVRKVPADPAGMLVVVGDGTSASFVVIDGSDLAEPDPPMWQLTESGGVRRCADSTTAWFARCGEDLMSHGRRLARRDPDHYEALFRS